MEKRLGCDLGPDLDMTLGPAAYLPSKDGPSPSVAPRVVDAALFLGLIEAVL